MNPTFVNAAGLRLRVSRTGEGRPLLLITGIGAHLDMWAPFERLVTDRELIAFDAPGVGLSQRPRAPLRMHQLARIVRELMDVTVCGGWCCARRRPVWAGFRRARWPR
jgi:poly(3-hydroxyoctanoate) depolymerase